MKLKWQWLGLTIAALIVTTAWVAWGEFAPTESARIRITQAQPIAAPTVNAQRLYKDVQTLAYRRFAAADRQRARNYIVQALRDAGWTPQLQDFGNGTNIYAQRIGTHPNAGTILLGGHYDTVERSPGADDNATAVATVLETARLLAHQSFPRTLQLVLFDLEEVGLLGSEAFVQHLPPTENLRGAIVMDMIGYTCPTPGCQSYPPLPIQPPTDRGNFLAVLGDSNHQPLLDRFTAAGTSELPPVLTLAIPTFGHLTPDVVRSDHAPFWKNGLGAVLVTDTANFRNPNYHQPGDLWSTIDPTFFKGAAQIVVNAITALVQETS